jgi:hypothetical protein
MLGLQALRLRSQRTRDLRQSPVGGP